MSTTKTTTEVRRTRMPTHPGAVLREDVLVPMGLSVTESAARLGVSRKTLSAILNERAGISPRMAIRIGLATNTSAESWLQMQSAYDLWHARMPEPEVRSLAG